MDFYNKIIDNRLSLVNCSLISDISDTTSTGDTENSSKQVRFVGKDLRNGNKYLNSSVISDASLLDTESDLNCKMKNNYLQILNSTDSITDGDIITNVTENYNDKSNDIEENTSVWSCTVPESESSKGLDSNVNLFHAIDNLPTETTESSSINTLVYDDIPEIETTRCHNYNSLHQPMINSSSILKSKIDSLNRNIQKIESEIQPEFIEIAKKKLENKLESDDDPGIPASYETDALLSQALNFKTNFLLYPELTDVNVRDDSIVEAEQNRIAALRRRIGMNKMQKKFSDDLPEPDLLEFYDEKKHKFSTLNLSMPNGIVENLKQTFSFAEIDLYRIFSDRFDECF